MEDFIVSARKYRPTTFDTVVGQGALTTTLKNATLTGKLAHAYLFCGPRGVGKTTCARIFAKTINCLNPSPAGEACEQCESCRAFNEQRSFNIHELDAASNNSVDDIRVLIDQVRIPPQVGKYKVFIIDEVHMLSAAAFNAFLKTLEEPPAHVIFILATTEKHKILPTILSRCQIYDFKRMEIHDIAGHLKNVAEREGIRYEEDALHVIAEKADGGMRDALSLFDQIVSFTGGDISYKQVIENLNVLDYDHFFRLTDYLFAGQVPQALLLLGQVLNSGFDGNLFINGLASHLRNLLMSSDPVTLPLLEVGENVRSRYCKQAGRCAPRFLYRALKLCNDCDLNYKASHNQRLLVELTLIQLAEEAARDGEPATAGSSPQGEYIPAPQPSATTPVTASETPSAPTAPSPTPTVSATPQTTPSAQRTTTPSIRLNQSASEIPVAVQQAAEVHQSVEGETPLTAESLRINWLRFAEELPKEEEATAGRMRDIEPILLDDDAFEACVFNEMALSDLTALSPRIEAYFQQHIDNRKLRFRLRLAKQEEREAIPYTPQEKLKALTEQNPAVARLQTELGLTF